MARTSEQSCREGICAMGTLTRCTNQTCQITGETTEEMWVDLGSNKTKENSMSVVTCDRCHYRYNTRRGHFCWMWFVPPFLRNHFR